MATAGSTPQPLRTTPVGWPSTTAADTDATDPWQFDNQTVEPMYAAEPQVVPEPEAIPAPEVPAELMHSGPYAEPATVPAAVPAAVPASSAGLFMLPDPQSAPVEIPQPAPLDAVQHATGEGDAPAAFAVSQAVPLAAEPPAPVDVQQPEVELGVDEDGRFVRQFVQSGPVIVTQAAPVEEPPAVASMPEPEDLEAAFPDQAALAPGQDPKHFDWWHPEPNSPQPNAAPQPTPVAMPIPAPQPEPAPQVVAVQPAPAPEPVVAQQPAVTAHQPQLQAQPAPEPEVHQVPEEPIDMTGSPTGATELVLADGQRWPVDDPLLVGRAPQAYPGEDARLVRVASPHHDISRTHVRIELYDGAIWATDRDSTNGTVVHNPGQEPLTAHPNQPVHVWVGGIIDIGDGMSIRVQ